MWSQICVRIKRKAVRKNMSPGDHNKNGHFQYENDPFVRSPTITN